MILSKTKEFLRSGCPRHGPISFFDRRTSKADSTKLWEFRQIVVRLFSTLETAASGTMWCPCGAPLVALVMFIGFIGHWFISEKYFHELCRYFCQKPDLALGVVKSNVVPPKIRWPNLKTVRDSMKP